MAGPAESIVARVRDHGGVEEVAVSELIETWKLSGWDVDRAEEVAAALKRVGIAAEPPLTGAGTGDRVRLRVVGQDVAASTLPLAPAGWQPDPRNASKLRYWDGSRWTDRTSHRRVGGPEQPAVSATRAKNDAKPPWWKRTWVLVTTGLVGLLIVAAALSPPEDDNGEDNASNDAAQEPAPPPPAARLRITSPHAGDTVRARTVVVRGTVTPVDAEVEVDGAAVNTRGGRFSTRVSLSLGANDIAIDASQPDGDGDSLTLDVTRRRSEREVAQLRERRRQAAERRRLREQRAEERRQQEIAAQTKTFSGSGSKNIGSITVDTESILEWTNNDDSSFRQMLIYDKEFGISVSSDAASGDTVVPAGTYSNITVAGGSNWTITIRPR